MSLSPRLFLPALALLLAAGLGVGTLLKVRQDEAHFAALRSQPPPPAPAPSLPAGIDGRPLDPTMPTAPLPPPKHAEQAIGKPARKHDNPLPEGP